MANTMREIMNPCLPTGGRPGFPNASEDWTEDGARVMAKAEDIQLTDGHLEVLCVLQNYFARHGRVSARELNDALEEKFHSKGGLKYLYGLFPGGPVVQGCRLAGLEIPHGNADPT